MSSRSMNMTEAANLARKPGIRGSHVLLMLIGFFVTVFVVNGIMIYKAESTFGGIETEDAYRKGVAYNESLAKNAKQSLLGWKDEIKVVGTPYRLQVSLHGKDNAAIAGKRIVATVGRPATNRYDMTFNLVETSPGLYEAELSNVGEGTWIVDLSAYDAGNSREPVYQARRRAWIAP